MKTAVVILAAGQGVRMKSARPKVMHAICGKPILGHVIDAARTLNPDPLVVVVGNGSDEVRRAFASGNIVWVEQPDRRGTGHALGQAEEALKGFSGRLVVLCGDAPLVTPETLSALMKSAEGRLGTVLTCEVPEPAGYGRVVRDHRGDVTRIVEHRDATPEELRIQEINSGGYAFEAPAVFDAVRQLKPVNAQGEYYLTDVLPILMKKGRVGACTAGDPDEVLGINSRRDLAFAAGRMRDRILRFHTDNGVTIVAPDLTYIESGVEIGQDTVVEPFTVLRSGVRIGKGCEVGPFCQLRAGAVLEDGAEVGNFVEMKKARLGARSKAKHLSYLGDATIGAKVNIGAGTITANYDGVNKHPTVIGDGASTGSHTVLVAPSTLGKGAKTGAGAVVVRADVPDGETWVGVPARPIEARKPLTPPAARRTLPAPKAKRSGRGG
jgi:bifunctional UDP-N-acetylglucosamine pyrophosphorylase/glucosamine-1-phosphate N-acetyltransferase